MFAALAVASSPAVQAQSARRGRECRRGAMTQYVNALVARNPSAAPVAPTVRVSEDGVETTFDDGVWETGTRLGPYRQDMIDVRRRIVGGCVADAR